MFCTTIIIIHKIPINENNSWKKCDKYIIMAKKDNNVAQEIKKMNFNNCLKETLKLDFGRIYKYMSLTHYIPYIGVLN